MGGSDYPAGKGAGDTGPTPGTAPVVVVTVPERFGNGQDVEGAGVIVVPDNGPGPSGSTTVVGGGPVVVVALVVSDGLVVSVGEVSVVVMVVVGVL
ncbi:hypothetical protein TUM20985_42310 [Mycobacterium antarcticum]|uniref:hypothetical protein n=1 Tax=unclassified Mycolicibacterium TaxID=2636767 RepID=UPI0023A5BA0D|nr:hypothetical protein TUM20985_42310 [Mycolicibacterium sp. TUM20985]GLP76852.1 hypothetical protein TUM20983_39620 [Mycolicibacterium sp. TUM20983]